MNSKTIFCLVFTGLLCVVSSQDMLSYRIETTKDTILFGEPIIVKCKLANTGNTDIAIFSYPGAALLTYDYAAFYLNDRNNQREYKYGVFTHASIITHSDTFILKAKDSVYYYTVLSWDGKDGFVHLEYENLIPGYYRIRSTYLSLESNVDSFYATSMSAEDQAIFERVGMIVDEFWSWPENTQKQETRKEILNNFPQLIEEQESVLSPFCHYMLWRIVFSEQSRAEDLADRFFRRYANSPLSEKLAFDLYRYYAWHQKDVERGESFVLAALMEYPNNLTGYFYLKLKHKEERLR